MVGEEAMETAESCGGSYESKLDEEDELTINVTGREIPSPAGSMHKTCVSTCEETEQVFPPTVTDAPNVEKLVPVNVIETPPLVGNDVPVTVERLGP